MPFKWKLFCSKICFFSELKKNLIFFNEKTNSLIQKRHFEEIYYLRRILEHMSRNLVLKIFEIGNRAIC